MARRFKLGKEFVRVGEALDGARDYEQMKLHNEFSMTKKRPAGYDHNLYTRLKDAQKQMKEFTKRERKILDDPNLSTDERDKRQLAIQKRRVELAERVLR